MKTKLTKKERRLLATSLGAIALLGAVAVGRVSLNAEPRLNIPAPAKRPSPNGFDLYLRAAKTIVPAAPAVDEVNDSNAPAPQDEKARAQKYSLTNKERWLRQNNKAFAIFQTALKTPSMHPVAQDPSDMFPV